MKQIIFFSALFFLTSQGKAYTLSANNGHEYKFYSCGQKSVSYTIKTYVLDKYTYGYAQITAYLSNNTTKSETIRGSGDTSYGERKLSGTISASGSVMIVRVKLAVSGELKTYVTHLSQPSSATASVGVVPAWGRASVNW